MLKRLRVPIAILSVLVAVVGWGGIPAALTTWSEWLTKGAAYLNHEFIRTAFVGIGVVGLVTAVGWPQIKDFVSSYIEPPLDILFGEGSKYEQYSPVNHDSGRRLYRVGIRNNTGKAIKNIQVEISRMVRLSDMSDDFNHNIPAVLKQWNDNIPDALSKPHKQSFDLSPKDWMYIDVARLYESPLPGVQQSEQIMLFYASLGSASIGRGNLVPKDKYELTISAKADEQQSKEKRFVLEVNDDGKLVFTPV